MQVIQFKGTLRTDFGKKGAKSVRKENQVPCSIYGGEGETVLFSLDKKALNALIYTPNSFVVELDIDGKKETAVMREIQFHPVKEYPLHIDFYRVTPGKPVAIDIPIKISGHAEGVKAGGKFVMQKRKLRVSGCVEFLPDTLDVDITNLGVGKSIFVGDLKYDNLQLLTPQFASVCTVLATRAAAAATDAAEK